MVLLFVFARRFSQISRTSKYATNEAKASLYKRDKIKKENKIFDGMNSMNTNYLQIGVQTNLKALELKPIQHPEHLYDSDTNIVSYKVPPKNLTPYYHIPNEALAQVVLRKFE